MTARENAEAKARRYLCEGRLTVLYVRHGGTIVRATCRGDGRTYKLGFYPGDGWKCDCPGVSDRCAHLLACRLVTEAKT